MCCFVTPLNKNVCNTSIYLPFIIDDKFANFNIKIKLILCSPGTDYRSEFNSIVKCSVS